MGQVEQKKGLNMGEMQMNMAFAIENSRNPRGAGRKPIPMAGRAFGRWTVIEKAGLGPGGHVLWICRCGCGALASVTGDHLRMGRSRSCGCLSRDKSAERMREINRERMEGGQRAAGTLAGGFER
jgi:hypothetical protein